LNGKSISTSQGVLRERHFINSRGKKIFSRQWIPDRQVDAFILLLPGYSEHSGRYDTVAKKLNDAGLAVFSIDYEGHGQSSGLRADIREFSYYVDDAIQLFRAVRDENGFQELPFLVHGQCVGALVAEQMTERLHGKVDGLLLTAPLFSFAREVPKIVQDTAGYVSSFAAKFPIMSINLENMSSDKQVINDFLDDEWTCKGRLRARMASHIIEHGKKARKKIIHLQIPTWIGHGADDQFADPRVVKQLLEKDDDEWLDIEIYPDRKHFILHEPGWEEIVDDMLHWINDTCLSSLEKVGLEIESSE